MYYTFTPPVAPRVFTVLQVFHLDEASPRKGLVTPAKHALPIRINVRQHHCVYPD